MARLKRTGARIARTPPTTTTVAPARTVTDWRRDAVVMRLTAKVHGLLGAAARRSAEEVVKIGSHLQQIHGRLPHGQWLDWLEENAPFSRSTADNYMHLTAWSQRVPAQFARLRHLGPGKLYVLALAPPRRVVALRPGKLVAIPGGSRRKSIETMSAVELGAVIGDLAPPAVRPVAPIGKVVQDVRAKVGALGAAADVMLARIDEVDADVVATIRADLLGVLERLEVSL